MKKTSITGLVCAIALSLAAPALHAEPSIFARAPIRAWHGQHFNIVPIDSLDDYDLMKSILISRVNSLPHEVEALQAAIRANRALAAALMAHNVQIRNIVAIQQALDGNLVFYLR